MKKKILVIDDEDAVRDIFEKILVKAGYIVFSAGNGFDALKLLERVTVDLIMLDVQMPGMSGLQFLKALKETDGVDVPVLMITGHADVGLRIECYTLGVYDFIRKPEDTEVMLKRVENGLKIGDIINYNRMIKSELIMAIKLQGYLFPPPRAVTRNVEIFAWTRPLTEIGGDLYDYIILNNSSIIFFVSDVSGHGISAAMYTGIVKMLFRNAVKTTLDPGEIITFMNQEISGNIPVESFITMFCGCFDPLAKSLDYANAGHPMPYVLTRQGVLELEGNGPFMGPIGGMKFNTYRRTLEDARGVIVYTDGIMDIMDENDRRIGKKVILEILKSRDWTYEERVRFIRESLEDENVRIYDDGTVFLMNFTF